MFNSLASYFIGNGNRNATDITQDSQQSSGATDEAINNFKFVTTNDDDEAEEWLLVEKGDCDGTPQHTDSEEEIPFVEIKNSPAVRTRHSRNNSNVGSHDGALNSLPSSPVPNSMDDSWFVTPPPCFTSTNPINVVMSPLENLLIEHPSMSVYHSIRSSMPSASQEENAAGMTRVFGVDLSESIIADYDLEANEELHPALNRPSAETAPSIGRNRAQSHANHMTEQQVKQVMSLKHSQKAHEKKNRQQMCRNLMERGNKVREVNGKGGRQKRSDMTHCKVISRANNNRKC